MNNETYRHNVNCGVEVLNEWNEVQSLLKEIFYRAFGQRAIPMICRLLIQMDDEIFGLIAELMEV